MERTKLEHMLVASIAGGLASIGLRREPLAREVCDSVDAVVRELDRRADDRAEQATFRGDVDRVLDAMVEIGKPTSILDTRRVAGMRASRVCAIVNELISLGVVVRLPDRTISLDPAAMTAYRAEMAQGI